MVDRMRGGGRRSSDLELLRIAAMLIIVIGHLVYWSTDSGGKIYAESIRANTIIAYLLGAWGNLSNLLFITLSSWFLCDANGIHIKKWLTILIEILLCNAFIFVLLRCTGLARGIEQISARNFIINLMPHKLGDYWFVNSYLRFYLLMPVLQFIVRKCKKYNVEKLPLILSLLYPIFDFFFGMPSFDGVGQFVCVFFITSYLKHREGNFIERHCALLSILVYALVVAAMFGMNFLGHLAGLGVKSMIFREMLLGVAGKSHLHIILLALSLFYVFKNHVKAFYSPVINAISKTTLGVYILHCSWMFYVVVPGTGGHLTGPFLNEHLLHCGEMFYTSRFYTIYLAACGAALFAVCSITDFVLMQIADGILDRCTPFDALCRKVDKWCRLP